MHLHLVTDRSLTLGRSLLEIIPAAIQGGVSVIQLREKDCTTLDFINLGSEIAGLLKPYKIPLLINDRIDVALAVGANGVHIGQQDVPYPIAREILGPQAVIGLSIENEEQALEAEKFDVAYLGLSPIFATPTKTDTAFPLGLDGLRKIRQISSHRLIAIGGINSENASNVIDAGADGLAVVSAICSAHNPCYAARALRQFIPDLNREEDTP